MAGLLIAILFIVLVIVISCLPLYLAVAVFGGRPSIIKVILVGLIVPILSYIIERVFDSWVGLLSFIALIAVYRYVFRLNWINAFLAWLLSFVFAGLMVLLLVLLGVTLPAFLL